jgi:hypothetical protein
MWAFAQKSDLKRHHQRHYGLWKSMAYIKFKIWIIKIWTIQIWKREWLCALHPRMDSFTWRNARSGNPTNDASQHLACHVVREIRYHYEFDNEWILIDIFVLNSSRVMEKSWICWKATCSGTQFCKFSSSGEMRLLGKFKLQFSTRWRFFLLTFLGTMTDLTDYSSMICFLWFV